MNFADVLKGVEAEGKEKHVPIIDIYKSHGEEEVDLVRVIVGKDVPHPNTVEHYIAWIELYGVKKDGQVVDLGRATFGPTYTNPNARFQVNVGEFKVFCALAYCNIHGVWQNCIEVE
jgi:superoxide reductase